MPLSESTGGGIKKKTEARIELPSLSVLIITANEEHNIRRCLESVKWADEIIIVDAESQDRTVEIARQFTDRVFVRAWQGYTASKNFGIQQASGEWLLWVDADEEITPELAEEIRTVLAAPVVDGFLLPRQAYFLGRWIRHGGWYPGFVLRLIRRNLARFSDKSVHESLLLPKQVKKLNHPILHFTDPSIHHYFTKLNRYTSLAAADLWQQGKRFHFIDLVIRPIHLTLKMYLFKAGFLDGFQGFLLALFSGVYVVVKYAKLWEIQNRPSEKLGQLAENHVTRI